MSNAVRKLMPGWAKPLARKAVFGSRRLGAARRALPSFITIGTQKGGTTSLHDYLCHHPQLHASSAKEVHFFDSGLDPAVDTFAAGELWYRSHFPLTAQMQPGQQAYETSPLYLFNPEVPARIAALLPDVKLIALLRDPVERAISQYFHEKRHGFESLPICDAFDAEDTRVAPALANRDYKDLHFIHSSYKHRGHYREQLERFFACFAREQLLVLDSAVLFSDPNGTLQRVCEFVGVDATFTLDNVAPSNVGNDKKDIDPALYASLRDYFQPHNEALYELLGEDFGW